MRGMLASASLILLLVLRDYDDDGNQQRVRETAAVMLETDDEDTESDVSVHGVQKEPKNQLSYSLACGSESKGWHS